MAYVVPGILVYQQLATNGGVANITPNLDACIIGPAYNVVAYTAGSTTSLTETAALASPGGAAFTLTDNTHDNTIYLGSTIPGQVVDASTVAIYLNSCLVESKVMYGTGTAGTNAVTYATYTGSGDMTAGSNVIANVSNPSELNIGDLVTVSGAGPSGGNLLSTITATSGSNVTIADNASSSVTGTTVSRTSFNNLNSNSSTLRVESGDSVLITYGSTLFNTTVLSTVGVGNTMTGINLSDVLPTGITVPFTLSVRKTFNNLLLPVSYNSHTNYDASNVTVNASIVINPLPQVSYGTVVSGQVNVPYIAMRTDLSGSVLDINNIDELTGTLGVSSPDNPLCLAVQLALANTTGRIKAIAVPTNDLEGYQAALDLAENQRLYALIPLTQSIDILETFQQHVVQYSSPENASWRIAIVNTEIPSVSYVGMYNPNLVNVNSGNNTVTLVSSNYVLTASNAQFVSDGVVPGDYVIVTYHTPTSQTITSMQVLEVMNNQQLIVDCPIALTAVNFYVQRTLTKSQQADIVAANSTTFNSSRVIHIQPDLVGVVVNSVTEYLPGYYLCAAVSGLVSGLPAQQSLTNIGLAGVTDLQHSNRYFTRAQLSTIAGAGTCLLVQEAAGTIPYIRHSLTTDMSVLQYRELQQVKNIDYCSYFFHDILKGFPGVYNITPDTLQTLRATLIAGAKLLEGKVLPKIGPPLLDHQIVSLAQDSVNLDTVVVNMNVSLPTVMNYVNLYLIY